MLGAVLMVSYVLTIIIHPISPHGNRAQLVHMNLFQEPFFTAPDPPAYIQ